jgi:hypothetical protein
MPGEDDKFDLNEEIPDGKEKEVETKSDPKLDEAQAKIEALSNQLKELSERIPEKTHTKEEAKALSAFDEFVKINKMDPKAAEPFRKAVSAVVADSRKDVDSKIHEKIDNTSVEVIKYRMEKELDAAKAEIKNQRFNDELPVEVLEAMIANAVDAKNVGVITQLQQRPGEYMREQYDLAYMRYHREPKFKKDVEEFKASMAKEAESAKLEAGNRSGSAGSFAKRHPDVTEEKDAVAQAKSELFQYM